MLRFICFCSLKNIHGHQHSESVIWIKMHNLNYEEMVKMTLSSHLSIQMLWSGASESNLWEVNMLCGGHMCNLKVFWCCRCLKGDATSINLCLLYKGWTLGLKDHQMTQTSMNFMFCEGRTVLQSWCGSLSLITNWITCEDSLDGHATLTNIVM